MVYYPPTFARCAKQIEGVELVAAATAGRGAEAIAGSIGKSPQEYATEYGLRLYDDPVEMVRREGLEAVFVCGEFSRMVELVEALAPLGVHLYIAKAMANDAAKAERIVRACQGAGIIAASGPTMRFDAGLRAARQRIAAGEIGQVHCLRVMHQHGTLSGWPAGDWYPNPQEGGPALSLGWYIVDTIRWLSGSEIERAYAEYDNFATPESPFMDNGKAILRPESGAIASADMYFSTKWSFPSWEIEAVGSKGAIKTMQTGYEGMLFDAGGVHAFHRNSNDMVLAEIADWVRACRQGAAPEVSVTDAARNLAGCFAMRQSAQEGAPVRL
jgi:predicted dehydrogenase